MLRFWKAKSTSESSTPVMAMIWMSVTVRLVSCSNIVPIDTPGLRSISVVAMMNGTETARITAIRRNCLRASHAVFRDMVRLKPCFRLSRESLGFSASGAATMPV